MTRGRWLDLPPAAPRMFCSHVVKRRLATKYRTKLRFTDWSAQNRTAVSRRRTRIQQNFRESGVGPRFAVDLCDLDLRGPP